MINLPRQVPDCCWNCKHHDDDWNEFRGVTYHYCMLNIVFPTKKNTCKRQSPIKDTTHEEQNQCDGCRQGLLVVDGLHRDENGHAFMTCTKNRYST